MTKVTCVAIVGRERMSAPSSATEIWSSAETWNVYTSTGVAKPGIVPHFVIEVRRAWQHNHILCREWGKGFRMYWAWEWKNGVWLKNGLLPQARAREEGITDEAIRQAIAEFDR